LAGFDYIFAYYSQGHCGIGCKQKPIIMMIIIIIIIIISRESTMAAGPRLSCLGKSQARRQAAPTDARARALLDYTGNEEHG